MEGGTPAPSVQQLSARARLQTFLFCDVADLGACLAVSRSWHSNADSEPTWAAAYEHTQRTDIQTAVDGTMKALIQRPFRETAVGWRISVLTEADADGAEHYVNGQVIAYDVDSDAYLVAYDGEDGLPREEIWEWDRIDRVPGVPIQRNPSLAGRSRFVFIAPPGDVRLQDMSSPACETSSLDGSLLRFGSWKQELEQNVQNVPSRLLHRFEHHADEVLFVTFSPCGMRLASCSRDCRTIIYRRRCGDGCGDRCASPGSSSSSSDPCFDQEAVLQHKTPSCRAVWWPAEPYTTIMIMTEDVSYQGFHGASTVEIWRISSDEVMSTAGTTAAGFASIDNVAPQPPLAGQAQLIFRRRNKPFDIHTAIVPWPLLLPQDLDALCFLAGNDITYEAGRCIQWLDVWRGPTHPDFHLTCGRIARPLALLRVECGMGGNYIHSLQAGPGEKCHKLLGMSGSTGHLCDQLVMMDLLCLRRQDAATDDDVTPRYNVDAKGLFMGQRILLSVKWSRCGNLILLNTRPYADIGHHGASARRADAFIDDPFPMPDLSTSMELLVLDANTMDQVGLYDGHFAFTTKECPFSIFTDDWSNAEFLASGGEDQNVYVWHRRHRRLLRRLSGHRAPVNAVSWNGKGILASASDDSTVILWAVGENLLDQ